jgi:hypothetical protein
MPVEGRDGTLGPLVPGAGEGGRLAEVVADGLASLLGVHEADAEAPAR